MPMLPFIPKCPVCKSDLDGYQPLNGTRAPKAGDVTVCCYCATPCEFTGGEQLRVLDMNRVPTELLVEVRRAIRIVKEIQQRLQAQRN